MLNPIVSLSRLLFQAGCVVSGGSFALASGLFYPWPLLAAAGMAAFRLRRRKTSNAFGSARWATAGDLFAANLLGQRSGLPLGYHDIGRRPGIGTALGRLFFASPASANAAVRLFASALGNKRAFSGYPLRWDGVHAAVFGGPGSGKSTALFIPALKLCREAAFVLDLKGELYRATARFRAKRFGHKIFVIDPYQLLGIGTHRYNPLADIDPASPYAADDLRDLANAIVFRSGREPDSYWLDQAELALFAGMAFALTHGQPQQRQLLEVQEIIADTEARTAAIEAMTHSEAWGGAIRRIGHQLGQLKDREGASVISSALRQLNFLHSQPIAECLYESNFDFAELLRGRATCYVVIPPDRLQSQAPFIRLMLASVIRGLFREGTSSTIRLRIFLDEAAALGKMPCVDQALSIGRGFGAAICFGYQSMGQLLTCYPEGQHQTFLSCLGCQIFLGAPADYQGAEYLQNILGDQTIGITSSQSSSSRSYTNGQQAPQEQYSTSHSTTYSEHGRKLIQASETFNLQPRQAVVFLPGRCRPVLTTMLRFFEDRSLAGGWVRRLAGHLRILAHAVTFFAMSAMLLGVLLLVFNERQKAPPAAAGPKANNAANQTPWPAPGTPSPPVPKDKLHFGPKPR